MRKEITNPVGKWWVVANRSGDLHVTDGDMPERVGSGWLRATYGVGFVESLPDIANGEMTEIRIKYTAEKCE